VIHTKRTSTLFNCSDK